MKFLKRNFLSGLPAIVTLGVLVWVFTTLDGFLAGPQKWLSKLIFSREFVVPGIGLFVILVATLVVGFVISHLLAHWMKRLFNYFFDGVPLVKMLYESIRDLFNAFVGENKSFNRPVLVRLFADSQAAVIGFVTNEDLALLGLQDQVAVYLPQSYNFAGNLLIVPQSAITPIEKPSGDVMKFIVSGGISVPEPVVTPVAPTAPQ